jgi:predicted nucleotidyltransferase
MLTLASTSRWLFNPSSGESGLRIAPNDTIAGLPAVKLRNALRRGSPFVSQSGLAMSLTLDTAESMKLICRLEADGYIARTDDSARWLLTIRGTALAMAKSTRPFNRSVADRHLFRFLERVHEANASEYWLYWIDEVFLFGSMLSDTSTPVGDVDLAVRLTPRWLGNELEVRLRERSYEARAGGRQFSNVTQSVFWPQEEQWRFLRGRSNVLSLTDVAHDHILELAAYRRLYVRPGVEPGE